MSQIKYVALGDSFTEGVGDELSDGTVRGWADLLAHGLAATSGGVISYANFAIRGKLLGPIIEQQLDPALQLEPTLVTFNGGGNDMLRPSADLPALTATMRRLADRLAATGARVVLLSGGNPTARLPMRAKIQARGDLLNDAVRALAAEYSMTFVDNWNDRELSQPQYWAQDRIHLNGVGHHRVAANVLAAIDRSIPDTWTVTAPAPSRPPSLAENAVFFRHHVGPWITRRLTGRSSGDGREPKYAQWQIIGG